MRGSFIASISLHVLLIVVLTLIGRRGEGLSKPLPETTVVRLIRPRAIAAQTPPTISKELKAPDVAPPMKLPPKTKPKPKTEKPKPKPDKPKPKSTKQPPKELVGEAGTLKLQQPGFEYDFYLALIQSKIERNFRPPPGVRGQHLATVAFTITKNGGLTGVALILKSGNLLIDQSAIRAVRAAGRFPPLPPRYEKGELGINFEFLVNAANGR